MKQDVIQKMVEELELDTKLLGWDTAKARHLARYGLKDEEYMEISKMVDGKLSYVTGLSLQELRAEVEKTMTDSFERLKNMGTLYRIPEGLVVWDESHHMKADGWRNRSEVKEGEVPRIRLRNRNVTAVVHSLDKAPEWFGSIDVPMKKGQLNFAAERPSGKSNIELSMIMKMTDPVQRKSAMQAYMDRRHPGHDAEGAITSSRYEGLGLMSEENENKSGLPDDVLAQLLNLKPGESLTIPDLDNIVAEAQKKNGEAAPKSKETVPVKRRTGKTKFADALDDHNGTVDREQQIRDQVAGNISIQMGKK